MSSIEKNSALNSDTASIVSVKEEEIIISKEEEDATIITYNQRKEESNSEKLHETDEEIRNKFTDTHLFDQVRVEMCSHVVRSEEEEEKTENDFKFKLLSKAQKEYETKSINNTTNFLKGCKWFLFIFDLNY